MIIMDGIPRLENKYILIIVLFLGFSLIVFRIWFEKTKAAYFYTAPPAPILLLPPDGARNAPWKKSEWAESDEWTFKWQVENFDVEDNEEVKGIVLVDTSYISEGDIDVNKEVCEKVICSLNETNCNPEGEHSCNPIVNFSPSKLYYYTVKICTKKFGDDKWVCSKNGHSLLDPDITNYRFITKSYLEITKEDATEIIKFLPRHYVNPPPGVQEENKLELPLFEETNR